MNDGIKFLSAEEEDYAKIAQANAPVDEKGEFQNDRIKGQENMVNFQYLTPEDLNTWMLHQIKLLEFQHHLIPFLENDDANRALMGSNMQRQAVPLIKPQAPIVGTGLRRKSSRRFQMLDQCRRRRCC
jgi:DNA-directed RNA polymerase subunit beta